MTTPAHPFSVFGPGPYVLVGFETTDDREAEQNRRKGMGLSYTTNLCGGGCDLCGTAIWNVYTFEAGNGRRFKVGCDCAEKAGEGAEAKSGRRRIEREAYERKSKAQREAELQAQCERNLADPEIAEAITDAAVAHWRETIMEFEDLLLKASSRHLGAVGQREKQIVVYLEKRFVIEDFYNPYGGGKICYKFRTVEGHHSLVWWTTTGLVWKDENGPYELGDKLMIAATVKKHGEYDSEEQTTITRVKVVQEKVKTKKPRASRKKATAVVGGQA